MLKSIGISEMLIADDTWSDVIARAKRKCKRVVRLQTRIEMFSSNFIYVYSFEYNFTCMKSDLDINELNDFAFLLSLKHHKLRHQSNRCLNLFMFRV